MKTSYFSKVKAINGESFLLFGLLLFIIAVVIIAEPVTSIGFGGIALANLGMFGYPSYGDNARRKAATLYDHGTIATGVLEYNLFTNPALSVYSRNRTFPLSGSEIFFINSIKLMLNLPQANQADSVIHGFLRESFIQISVDEREKIKIPVLECIDFSFAKYQGYDATPALVTMVAAHFKRHRKLQHPIIINANSNVSVKLVTNVTSASALDTITFKAYLDGVKLDKLNDYEVDFVKNNTLEELSYSIYDVATLAATEETLEMFSNRNKAVTLFNKTLPLSDKENFQIEAIEIFLASGRNASTPADVLAEANDFYLEIVVDDVSFYQGMNANMFSLFHARSVTLQDSNGDNSNANVCEIITSVYVLPEPIIIPANSKASVKLRHGAIVAISGNVLVDFRGTLTRRVA